MIFVYVLIALWLGVLFGYAIHRSSPTVQVVHDGPQDGNMHTLLLMCAQRLVSLLDDVRPRNFIGVKRDWQHFNVESRSTLFENNATITTQDLRHDLGGVYDRMLPSVDALAQQIRAAGVQSFKTPTLPTGMDFAGRVKVHGLELRLLRGYDIRENVFITHIGVAV